MAKALVITVLALIATAAADPLVLSPFYGGAIPAPVLPATAYSAPLTAPLPATLSAAAAAFPYSYASAYNVQGLSYVAEPSAPLVLNPSYAANPLYSFGVDPYAFYYRR